jgi:ATP-binding cassette subfamily B (MDR/TAP) protein 1
VLLDGHNIKSMELKWLREQMGLVSQEPSLFAASIADNIRYGKLGGASMDDVVAAAKASCAHDFIDVLPKRYETQVKC